MRIVGGQYKGRRISVYNNFKARPTTDFAKESLFNIIANYFHFEDLSVLDLFSGTGSISFEFASRGSYKINAVEKDFRSAKFIRQVAQDLGIETISVYNLDAFKFISQGGQSYDIVFADPPYDLNGIESIPNLITQYKLVNKHGWFILEHSKTYNFTSYFGFREVRNYGSVHFSIFEF